ncbi:hypothetical protein AKO1_010172 [Acrasis kona]|uniref:Nucleosome assembly protein n=1 Tax=Acrasis kona TaxID=1008807 RepID=A0AAW2ZSK1_9EUKA
MTFTNKTLNTSPSVLPTIMPHSQSNKRDTSNIPFWLGNEDTDHINAIFHQYETLLCMKPNHNQFIGRVERHPCLQKEGLVTIDNIFIYRNDPIFWGKAMPRIKKIVVETTWSEQDGMPIKMCKTSERTTNQNGQTTFQLYSFPIFECTGDKPQYVYNHGGAYNCCWEVGYADYFNQCAQKALFKEVIQEGTDEEQEDDSDDEYEYEEEEEDQQEQRKQVVDYSYLLQQNDSYSLDNFAIASCISEQEDWDDDEWDE